MPAIAFAAFAVVGLMDAAHYAYWRHINGKPVPIGFVLLHEAPPWILWGLCVPAVLWLGERFRLEWPPRVQAVLVHLGGFALATLLLSLTGDLLELWLDVPPPSKPFLLLMRDTLVFRSSLALITYGATLGIGYAASYSARSRQLLELRNELQKAQLSALRMQLNPHFLFNTLHTVGALVREENPRGAVEMIEKLGDILRHVLRSDAEPDTPLRDEIEFLRKYLEIEQVRFGDRLRVTWQLDAPSESVRVPQLILQPLVENALRHGLASRARPGALTISARVANGELQLTITDDGVGLPADFPQRSGVGLANVRARLSRRYGDAASFSVAAAEPSGVTARIVLPLVTSNSGSRAE
jgi:signal transduction histidine kinase